jgi:spore maturation protein CgeB
MLDLINTTKINFNKSISVDVNYRNFETIACGACLLTNHLKELEELGFENGVNCLMYTDYHDCLKKIKFAKINNNWEKIANNGYEFSKNHTYTVRVRELTKQITVD